MVARQGAVCGRQFAGLTAHDTIVTFTLSIASATLTINPPAPSVLPGAQLQFVALADGQATTAVTWSALRGTISATGLYTAPQGQPSDTVTATSVSNPAQQATATVFITGALLLPIQRDSYIGTCSAVSARAIVQITGGTIPVTDPIVTFTVQGDATLSGQVNEAINGVFSRTNVFAGPSTSSQIVVTATSVENPNATATFTYQIDPIVGSGGVPNVPDPGEYLITRGNGPGTPDQTYAVTLRVGNSIRGQFQFTVPVSVGSFSATNSAGGSVTGSVSATGISGSFSDGSSTRPFDLRRVRRGVPGC